MTSANRSPFRFHKAYCEGGPDELGYWKADGRSERADAELVDRLDMLMIKRDRATIWKDTPAKQRKVIYLDVNAHDNIDDVAKRLLNETALYKALERTLTLKVDAVCEGVMESLLVEEKAIIWTLTRASVDIVADAMTKECNARDVTTRLREVNCRIFATHGSADVKTRNTVAREFREHKGACVLIATMDSMPESISLFGATTEHYAQLHFLAGPMEQSENRPYLKGTTKLGIFYYVAKGTVDERMINLVIPRLLAAEKVGASKDAAATAAAFSLPKSETFEDFIARLTANVPEDGQIDFGMNDDRDD